MTSQITMYTVTVSYFKGVECTNVLPENISPASVSTVYVTLIYKKVNVTFQIFFYKLKNGYIRKKN